jgi:tetratricopeptide (TPR) repeat protein
MVAVMRLHHLSRPGFRQSVGLIVFLAGTGVNAQTLDEARSLYVAGRLPEAVDTFQKVAEASQDKDPATAGAAWNNACVIQMNTGDLHGALADCREALRVRRIVGDDLRLARTLNNLGLVQQYLGEYETAAKHFDEALALNREAGDVKGQAINLANLGVVATQAGRYSRALDFHQRVMVLAQSHRDAGWTREQVHLARINQAVVLEKLGAYREALSLYKLVLPEVSDLDPRRQAGLSVNLGVAYRNLGDPVSAQQAFEAAKETYADLGDTAALSNVLLNLGLVYHLNLERPREAEVAYREALRLAEESGDRSEEIRDLCYLGRFLMETGRADEAESIFRRSLQAAEESGSAEGKWTSLEGLARISAVHGELREALRGLREAMGEIELARSDLERSSLRGEFFGQKRPVYAAAVEVLHRLSLDEPGAGHDAEAFAVAQRAKARVLLDALGPDALRSGPLDASRCSWSTSSAKPNSSSGRLAGTV